jgi:hypothetical protein
MREFIPAALDRMGLCCPFILLLILIPALSGAARAAGVKADIVDYFRLYYQQEIVEQPDAQVLEFLGNAAMGKQTPEQVLTPGAARRVIVDRGHGYLQIDDGSNTDQILTMTFYTKSNGSRLIVVAASDCDDACDFDVKFFTPADGYLIPVARQRVMPSIGAALFLKRGRPMPAALAGVEPKVNYVPSRVGTTMTLKPWYGYEVEERMQEQKDTVTRSAIRDIKLRWDRNQGVFVLAP